MNHGLWLVSPEYPAWALPEGRDNHNAGAVRLSVFSVPTVSGLNPTHINNVILGKLFLCLLFFLSVNWR